MKNILVAYATNAGSTVEVARAIAEELGKNGAQVEARPISQVNNVESYDLVVIGAPMMMGWHRSALNFVKKYRQELSKINVAYFLMAMSLTENNHRDPSKVPICVDPRLPKLPKNAERLSIKERYTTVGNYLKPVLEAAPGVKPVSIAIFGGKLDLFRLNWWQKLFVLIVVQAHPGEYRNWPFIRDWAAELNTTIG